jgi:hypothetical protein
MQNQEMSTDQARGGPRQNLLLWIGIVLPATAWMIQLFALYMLEDFISCTPGSRTPGVILGVGVRPIALLITVVLGGATAAAGLSSLRIWRTVGEAAGEADPAGRTRWMALAGMMSSVLFLLIIVIKVVPPLLIGVCQAPL